MDERDELRLGCETAYIDGSVASNSLYCPQFITIKLERKFYLL